MSKQSLKNTFGISIKNSALSAVELSVGSGNKIDILNFSHLSLESGIIEDNCIILELDTFKQALNQLLQGGTNGPIKSENVIISFPEEKTFSHRFKIPEDRLGDDLYIQEVARDFIPIDLRGAVIDYSVLKKTEGSKEVEIEFVAAQKNIIQPLVDVMTEIGLNVLFVDIQKNSLMRLCRNPLFPASEDFMAVHVNESATIYGVVNTSGNTYTLDSHISGHSFAEQLKETLKINLAQADNMLRAPQEQQTQQVSHIIGPSLLELMGDMLKLVRIANAEAGIQPKKAYLLGDYVKMPGFIPYFQKNFPGIKPIFSLDYLNLPSNASIDYLPVVGLALRAIAPPEDVHEINLLPPSKKADLISYYLNPLIRRILLTSTTVLTIMVLAAGFFMLGSYTEYKVSEREVQISLEKTESPYLLQTAKEKQEQDLLVGQIDDIIYTAIPPQILVKKMEQYNDESIQMIEYDYQLRQDDTGHIKLRAAVGSRTETESFISELENDPFFEEIISPLSNLTGRGERFVHIDLSLNLRELIQKLVAAESEDLPEENLDLIDNPDSIEDSLPTESTNSQPGAEGSSEEIDAGPALPSLPTTNNNENTN